jgi:hypothetical protein
MSTIIDEEFVRKTEDDYFRTNTDVGANSNALFIWNRVRTHLKLPELKLDDLPAYCVTHDCYHIIQKDYGCKRHEGTRKFRSSTGFLDGTDYIEYKNGVGETVSKKGERKSFDMALEQVINFYVKGGLWKEIT